eukprot:13115912-Heterocapsa_arctica.AAC.1
MQKLQRLPWGCRLRPSTGGATPSPATTRVPPRHGSPIPPQPRHPGTLHRPIPPDRSQGHWASS